MLLEALSLRPSGRAVLLDNEIERCIASPVRLFGTDIERHILSPSL